MPSWLPALPGFTSVKDLTGIGLRDVAPWSDTLYALECSLEHVLAQEVKVYDGTIGSLGDALRDATRFDHESLMDTDPDMTLLMVVAKSGRLRLIETMLQHNTTPGCPEINAQDQRGWTALTYAVQNGDPACVLALLKGGATVNGVDEFGRSALNIAARTDGGTESAHIQVISLLIAAGAHVNTLDSEKCTPLHHTSVCYVWNQRTFLLLRSGADFLVKNDEGNTAMHLLGEESVRAYTLIQYEVYKNERNALLGVVCALGADPCAVNSYGQTPIHTAFHSSAMCQIILDFFPRIDLSAKDLWGDTPLHYTPRLTDGFDWLIHHGADVDATNDEGNTPLHMFAMSPETRVEDDGHLSINVICMHDLVKLADLDVKNHDNATALSEAYTLNNFVAVGILHDEVTSFDFPAVFLPISANFCQLLSIPLLLTEVEVE